MKSNTNPEESMNEIPNAPISESRPETVLQTWGKALTKPSEQTFIEIASSPNAKASTAYLWVFVASLIQFFLVSLVQSRMMGTYMEQFGVGTGDLANQGFMSVVVGAICGAPVAAAVSTLFFAIGVFIVQWLAKMFGGRGTADQLAYAMASISAPYAIVAGILSLFAAIPYVGVCFSAILTIAGIYIFVLNVMAVKGVNQISWGAAIGSLLIPGLVIGLLCACLVGISAAVLVPLIQGSAPNFTP
jgi:hypothetical protein